MAYADGRDRSVGKRPPIRKRDDEPPPRPGYVRSEGLAEEMLLQAGEMVVRAGLHARLARLQGTQGVRLARLCRSRAPLAARTGRSYHGEFGEDVGEDRFELPASRGSGHTQVERRRSRRAIKFEKFLIKIDTKAPAALDVHVLVHSYSINPQRRRRSNAGLAAHPHPHLHFTPTGASWINSSSAGSAG